MTLRIAAHEAMALQDVAGLVYDAHDDSLFVEVDADEVHGIILVWKQLVQNKRPTVYHELKEP
jgi:hypothetical protein